MTHLVNEGGELVVETLDLLLLLGAYPLDLGVNFHMQGGQQALVDRDLLDPPGRTGRPKRLPAGPQTPIDPTAKAKTSQGPA